MSIQFTNKAAQARRCMRLFVPFFRRSSKVSPLSWPPLNGCHASARFSNSLKSRSELIKLGFAFIFCLLSRHGEVSRRLGDRQSNLANATPICPRLKYGCKGYHLRVLPVRAIADVHQVMRHKVSLCDRHCFKVPLLPPRLNAAMSRR